jgi:hypothetical protein
VPVVAGGIVVHARLVARLGRARLAVRADVLIRLVALEDHRLVLVAHAVVVVVDGQSELHRLVIVLIRPGVGPRRERLVLR